MSSTTEESRAVVQGLYDAAARGDHEALFSFVNDDIVVSPPAEFPWAGPHVGAEAWRDYAIPLVGMTHDVAGLKYELIADGDSCIAVITIGIKDSEDTVEYLELWTIDEGKAVRMKVYCHDPRPVRKQIEKLGL
jgi:ketosteroid isomerase-like protein